MWAFAQAPHIRFASGKHTSKWIELVPVRRPPILLGHWVFFCFFSFTPAQGHSENQSEGFGVCWSSCYLELPLPHSLGSQTVQWVRVEWGWGVTWGQVCCLLFFSGKVFDSSSLTFIYRLLHCLCFLGYFFFCCWHTIHRFTVILLHCHICQPMGSGAMLTNNWLTFYDTVPLSVISYEDSMKGIVKNNTC